MYLSLLNWPGISYQTPTSILFSFFSKKKLFEKLCGPPCAMVANSECENRKVMKDGEREKIERQREKCKEKSERAKTKEKQKEKSSI